MGVSGNIEDGGEEYEIQIWKDWTTLPEISSVREAYEILLERIAGKADPPSPLLFREDWSEDFMMNTSRKMGDLNLV
jgi:hypothetical protein